MKKNFVAFFAILFFTSFTGEEKKNSSVTIITYPVTKKVDVIDDYFGKKIPDPYRWLEDDHSEETKQWVDEQNKVTFGYLEKIPFRQQMKERLAQVWNYEKLGVPFKRGKYYFFFKNDGLQNQNVLYVQEGLNGTPRVLIDPNKFSADGTIALNEISIRKDGKYIAYNISKSGSDWNDIVVMEIATGKVLPDTIKWVKFSSAQWKGDGFFYSTYPPPTSHAYSGKNQNNKAFYHKLGTKQNEDQIVYADPTHPNRGWSIGITDDERFMALWGSQSTHGNSFAVKETHTEEWNWVDTNYTHSYRLIDNIGNMLLVHTNADAPKWQLVIIDPSKPKKENWKKIIPETNDLLESVSLCNGKIIAKYLKDVTNKLFIYSFDGKMEKEIFIPSLGIVNIRSDKDDENAFYSFTNYITPTTIYKYNITKNHSSVYFRSKVDFNSSDYESKQVFYLSKDGTKIPMMITFKKGIKLDGNNACFLYGYGGFNVNITPTFVTNAIPFLENGGVYAVANLRGGNEYGEAWHQEGIICNKQNVFDDFIAGAEYLIKEKYTSSQKLAIHGRSNGGLLVGAVMTQRPDLFKVCLPGVGVLDMLRYHKFTIGYYWASDYGRSDNQQQFECLVRYSPLHNVKEVEYPATLITTADHDDRVVPAHSFKFAAELQSKQKGNNPTLIRIDKKAGHGSGKPTSKQIEEWTDIWSFVFYNLGMEMNVK